ncbi:MAG TPA: DUF1549 domain-containing protein [Verrucomicrobiae bacterium]
MKTYALKPNRTLCGLLAVVLGASAAVSLAQTNTKQAPKARGLTDEQRMDGLYRLLDTNRDNKLSRQEFSKLAEYSPRLKGNADASDYLFMQLDKSGDDKLSLEEYRGLVDIQRAARLQGTPPPEPAPAPKAAAKPAMTERAPTSEELAFFENKIRPVLVGKCYECHSAEAEKVKGGLALDTREGLRNGGDTGHGVIPGDIEGSLLIKALRYTDSDLQMPPKKQGSKLAPEIIADFEKWVKMGAPDPRDGKAKLAKGIDLEKGKEHWAFQLPKKIAAPAVKDTAWVHNDIDKYVRTELDKKGLIPVGDADKVTLLRRVYIDLIGIPPTPEQVTAFEQDKDPKAFEKVVDKLLASPQFGERWGRHWLDVARYAESSGKELNVVYPHAWRYRDWVIQSFNEDKPYDQFLKEQLAGDLLPAKNETDKANKLIATGYLAIGPKSHNSRDFRQFQLDVADEQIDAVTQGMLGMTVACARCHDHKFDPVPQTDYYALAGIFMSTETRFGTPRFIQNNQSTPLNTLPAGAKVTEAPSMPAQQITTMQRQLATAKSELEEVRGSNDRAMFTDPRFIRNTSQIGILEKLLGRYDSEGKANVALAMGVQDKGTPRDIALLARGELDKPQEVVPRGFVQIVSSTKEQPAKINKGSGRLELAEWIASPENPMTARVMANRVWVNLFGQGIVASPDNFGTTGQKPSNQALLDHLAISFVENGWSVKQLVKQVVMSHTYQLSSEYSSHNYSIDPDNTAHWRMSKRRMDAEALRDSMLATAGVLDLKPYRGSVAANAEGPTQQMLRFGGFQRDNNSRSVYLPILRDMVPESLSVFDFAETSLVTGDREETTVPSQALYLMNSATVYKLAQSMADRLYASGAKGSELGQKGFELAFSRRATAQEVAAINKFFEKFYAAEEKNFANRDQLRWAALTAYCQALLGSAEFRIVN